MLGAAMEREIRRQPAVLAENVGSYLEVAAANLAGSKPKLIVLAARGSSDHAALYARYLFEIHLRVPVVLAAPSVLTKFGSQVEYPPCLAIGISQSGAAPDVAEVLTAMRSAGHQTLAVTNTPGSRITNAAESFIDLNCGVERSVAATMTYSSSLLAMYQVARALGAALPEPSANLPTDAWIESSKVAAESSSGSVLRSHAVFALGRGYSFCSAFETALKLMECALIPCKAYSTADFQHGPKALAGHGTSAIVFGPSLPFLREQGCTEVLMPDRPSGIEDPIAPLWEIAFGQWLALCLARARGLDPDDPRFIEKITETR